MNNDSVVGIPTFTNTALWDALLPIKPLPPQAQADAPEIYHSLRIKFGTTSGNGTEIAIPLILSSVPETLNITLIELWSVYIPLLLWLRASAAERQTISPTLIGIAGPAGSGKTSLAAILATLAQALPPSCFPKIAIVSMDAYHLPGKELEARGLKSVKGAIETIHGTALANDLTLFKEGVEAWTKLETFPLSPLIPSVSLASRPSWVLRDPNDSQTLLFPEYDRLNTHDPVLGAVRVDADVRILLVEGLFIARGDGSILDSSLHNDDDLPDIGEKSVFSSQPSFLTSNNLPLGPDVTAWTKVLSTLHATILLRVPLALCRARCLARRVRSVLGGVEMPPDTSVLSLDVCERLEMTVDHYRRADAPTWAAIREDARTRATLILRLPLPLELKNEVLNMESGDALDMPWQQALKALAASSRINGQGAFEGVKVVKCKRKK